MNALEVTNLTVDYTGNRGAVRAVDGVSFTVPRGALVAVVGETGSGKTTAALSAIGMLPKSATRVAGTTHVAGQDITRWSRRRLQHLHGVDVGLIPQDPTSSLDPLKPIGWQVAEALRIHRYPGDINAEVLALLRRVGLGDAERIAAAYPHHLSGGQRQRALIAGAIALRPQLLIADESTSALDVTVQKRVLDLLDELRLTEGTGVLLVTHDLAVAAERADHIVVLRNGRVQDSGTAREILTGKVSDYTSQLIAHAPALQPARFKTRDFTRSTLDNERNPAIVIRGLNKQFTGKRTVHAVQGVDLTIPRGTTHAIVGESGSGKSTIARLIMGLETPTSGSVTVGGVDTTHLKSRTVKRDFLRNTQMVYQSPFASLNPSRSILNTVAEPLRNFGLASKSDALQRASELLTRMALPETLHDRRPSELSGGQRQRVAIARAIAPEPEIVVLDEPVSALDVSVQAQILELLDDLQTELGLTYVFISHDLSVVRQISDTVTVLRAGVVEESGSAFALFTDPQSEYTRELLSAIPQAELSRPTLVSTPEPALTLVQL